VTYEVKELSAQDGQPVTLYKFANERGTFTYTSRASSVTYESTEYVPQAITHGDVSSSGDMTKDALSLRMPRGNEVAQSLLVGEVDTPTTLTIFRGHEGDFVVYWRGRVASSSASGAGITLSCESVFTSMRRPGLRARYQRNCRHSLYGTGCGVSREAMKVVGSATAVDGTALVVSEAGGFADGYFIGGYVRVGLATRFIVAHAGTALTLMRPMESLNSADLPAEVELFPGCDKSRETCAAKFGNLPNYGGFPWIPLKNPFGFTSIV
jgi:uncharacterized phage protein (TIGR02218 family)